MNTCKYMDKQIMDLSTNNDFINLHDDQHHITAGVNHPVRPIESFPNYSIHWAPDTKTNTNYSSPDSIEPGKLIVEKDLSTIDASLLSEIDHTVKKYADNLLHAIESVSARLSQLEIRSRQIEDFVVKLKLSVDNNHGNTDGKLRLVENILREVQDGVQVIKNKQDIMETQLQLAKLQVPKEIDSSIVDSAHHRASAPLQSHQQFPPVVLAQPPSPLPPPNAPPPPLQQKIPSQVELHDQFPQNLIPSGTQRETYFPLTGQSPENSSQQNQQSAPHQRLQTSIPPPPHQQYLPSPSSLYTQPPVPSQAHSPLPSVNPSQSQPPLIHHPEERHFIASQTYPQANTSQFPSHPSSGAPVSHLFYAAPANLFEPPSSRQGSGFSSAYGPSTGPGESYPYSGSTVQYGSGSPFKSQQLASPLMGQSGGNGYPQLPTTRILPQALPTAFAVSSGSSSPRTGNRVPIDDVVDKVTNMGFPRDQVRATVQRLTENGQSVDLNVVLDKLMNGG